jgi:hypothetical protein
MIDIQRQRRRQKQTKEWRDAETITGLIVPVKVNFNDTANS